MVRDKPLDWDAVLASPVPLKVVASCLETLQPVILENFRDAADLSTCLRASANVPEVRSSSLLAPDSGLTLRLNLAGGGEVPAHVQRPCGTSSTPLSRCRSAYGAAVRAPPEARARARRQVAGGPVEHRGLRLVDAAVFEPVPFRAAIADGCTHVLALCTRPPYLPSRLTKLVDDLMATTIKRAVMSPAYMLPAWKQEAENVAGFGATVEDMLVRRPPSLPLCPLLCCALEQSWAAAGRSRESMLEQPWAPLAAPCAVRSARRRPCVQEKCTGGSCALRQPGRGPCAQERMGRCREAGKPARAAAQIEALDPDSYKRPYFAGTHVFPAFPGAAASFISPVCTDVDLLEKGQAEGYNMVLRLFTDAEPLPQQPPAAAAAAPAAVANLPV